MRLSASAAIIEELFHRRVLILDGAMGTMIQRETLGESDYRGERLRDHPRDLKGNPDILTLMRPDVVRRVHDAYLDAGADIIETDTFTAQAISQADYGTEHLSYEMNVAAARIARAAADDWTKRTPKKPRFVAGALGPMNRSLSLSPDVNDPSKRSATFDQVKSAYAEQARGLLDGGADVLLIETIFDTLNSKACLVAIDETFEQRGERVPVMISVSITDKSGRTCWIEFQNASVVCPDSVRPDASVIVPETITGRRCPTRSENVSSANSAALPLSVSKIVSTRKRSAPPSARFSIAWL